MSCRDILPWPPFLWEWALCEGGTALWNQLITCPLIATVCLLSHLKHTYHIHQIYWPFTEPEFSKHFLLLYFSLFDQDTLKQERFLTWLRLLYKTPWCETDSSLHGNRLMTMSWLRCNSLICLKSERSANVQVCDCAWTFVVFCVLHFVSVVSSQLEKKKIHRNWYTRCRRY